jgi:hypothetical protein
MLVQPGAPEPGRRAPAQRHAAPVEPGQVHRPVDQHVEGEARAGAEAEQPHAALDPVAVLEQVDAEQLGGVAHVALELGVREAPAEECRHGGQPPLRLILVARPRHAANSRAAAQPDVPAGGA